MRDAVRQAAQRHTDAVGKVHHFRQAAEARGNPATVLLRKLSRLSQRTAGRDREDNFARCRSNPQRIAACQPVPPQAHDVYRRIKDDFKSLRFAGAAIKHGAARHDHFTQPFEWLDIATSKAAPRGIHEGRFNHEIWYELLGRRTTASYDGVNFSSEHSEPPAATFDAE